MRPSSGEGWLAGGNLGCATGDDRGGIEPYSRISRTNAGPLAVVDSRAKLVTSSVGGTPWVGDANREAVQREVTGLGSFARALRGRFFPYATVGVEARASGRPAK